jgi:hypothetical protein
LLSAPFDSGPQLVRHLALFVDAREDRGAPVFQFAQIQETFLEVTQLRVVEIVGHFLTVTRDKRNSRAFVEELHGAATWRGWTESSLAMRCTILSATFSVIGSGVPAGLDLRAASGATRNARAAAGLLKRGILP